MINNSYKKYNDVFIACMCLIISMYANSFCDAIKFSSAMSSNHWDWIWHLSKWGVDRVFLFLAGCYSFVTLMEYWQELKKDWKYALFHYPVKFKILAAGTMISFIIWGINYEWWRNFFDKA